MKETGILFLKNTDRNKFFINFINFNGISVRYSYFYSFVALFFFYLSFFFIFSLQNLLAAKNIRILSL